MHDPILEATGVKKEVIHDAFGFLFIVLVTVGYHTRLSSCILIIWLGVMNFFVNDFWNTTNDLRWVCITYVSNIELSAWKSDVVNDPWNIIFICVIWFLGDMTIKDLTFSKHLLLLVALICYLHLALVTFPLTKTKKIFKILNPLYFRPVQ